MAQQAPLTTADYAAPTSDHFAPADYVRFTNLVYQTCGIQLNASKQLMVETRLRKRLKETGAGTYRNYCKLLAQEDSHEELILLIDAITTNKTEVFREPAHFNYLSKKVLPDLGRRLKASRPIRVWSAGCSTGKEAYTLAMVLMDSQRSNIIQDFEILGTDICTQVLEKASQAVYLDTDIEPIPEALRKKYLLRSRAQGTPTFRIAPELRSTVRFQRLNFMDDKYFVDAPFDIVFCRNVIIYFDRPTQEQVVNKLAACLVPEGHFFTGHSETLSGLATRLNNVAPTIYRKATEG
jgi:chemotaxis protein methyltransferase CheR